MRKQLIFRPLWLKLLGGNGPTRRGAGLLDTNLMIDLGAVAGSLRASGRKPKARGYDALITAVAIVQGMPLYTANPDDVAHIEGLDLRPFRRTVRTGFPSEYSPR